ncbi:ABC transporter ATP-binding protein [Paenibacillus thermotolerans]|uniref:ABC transporter ATP-binding protein n=1 Tax=Paenibacillus thermotolerans TaxID=3027807 RepID=UPI0023678230|nr:MULTISPECIES: ABC transporter ATP-binding protein [unclassified Paenibacillus]
MNAVLQTAGLVKRSGNFQLGPIDLVLEPGLVVALVGPNGAGKSTLFSLLVNQLHPDQGEVQWFGGLTHSADEVEVKRRVGYVPEEFRAYDASMTAGEWLSFAARWYPSWNEGQCKLRLEKYNVAPEKKLKELSKGMQRKLSFIQAVSAEPDVLLLDEPSSGLDPFAWKAMTEDIRAFMEERERTVFFATHVMDEVRKLADCIAFLNEGKLLGFYEKDRLLDDWKTFWVETDPEAAAATAGVVHSVGGEGRAMRLVSSNAAATEQALKQAGCRIVSVAAVELEDILMYLMKR